MKDFSLYVILDPAWVGERAIAEVARALAKGGADLLQLRFKTGSAEAIQDQAFQIEEALQESETLFVINDDPVLAAQVSADGVHLGQEDMPVKQARRIVGRERLVGVSTRSFAEAERAESEGADYISIGDLFGTQTKKEARRTPLKTLAEIALHVSIPVVGIGGITLENCERVLKTGASAVAVSKDILNHPDLEERTRLFKQKLVAMKERRMK